jgi:hypothetical protein
LKQQFMDAGGDRPIIALGLRWLEDNCPLQAEPVLNHGDYRMGNLLVEGSRLTGVLDWEIAHFGDRHEDLAFGCLAVWRFARYDRPALGLGSLADYLAAYEAEAGVTVDPARFRFWTIYRTVWWALGCLKMAAQWRSGADRMLERVVISRRTSEQELDLLLLLEEDAPEQEKRCPVSNFQMTGGDRGEANRGEIATAVSEWLATVKDRMEGHDRFQLAVARNALGIIAREERSIRTLAFQEAMTGDILTGKATIKDNDVLASLRAYALVMIEADSPRYPALTEAKAKWPLTPPIEDLH